MGIFKKGILKIDDTREAIEDYIASHILARWSTYKKADDLRYIANMAIINIIITYAETQGLPCEYVPQEVREKVAKAGVKVEKKLNALLQKQLQKKSKIYKERHNV